MLRLNLFILAFFAVVMAKEVMIISTTDVHGYLYGHTDEPGVFIDFGDFRRFTECMETKYNSRTLLRLDSGDLIQGTGLSDFTVPPGIDIYKAFSMFGYDAATLGNHDAGEPSSMDYIVGNDLTDVFVSGNVFYDANGFSENNDCTFQTSNLIADPYRIIQRDGMVFLILGFLYGATTEDTVCNLNLSGFFTSTHWTSAQEEIQRIIPGGQPDVIVTLNHISSNDKQQKDIYDSVRATYPDSVMVMLNGHSHREQYGACSSSSYLSPSALNDKKCVYMESGCYMYGFGVISLTIEDGNLSKYTLENYDAQYDYLENKCPGFTEIQSQIATQLDNFIDGEIEELGVLDVVGVSNWFYDKDLIQTKQDSLWRLYQAAAIPTEMYSKIDPVANQLPEGVLMLFVNDGSMREDLFKGPILRENISNVLPFSNTFVFLETPMTGRQLKLVYEDINYSDDLHDDEIDYYITPLVYDDIQDDEIYTIISSDYDCIKVTQGMGYVTPEIDPVWTPISGVPNMMKVLELYIEHNFKQGTYEATEAVVHMSDVGGLENENVVYLTLVVIFAVATLIGQMVFGRKVTAK